jgi:hypothetical protein
MRKCPLSKTELQKKRRMFELTGENRQMRRRKMRDAQRGNAKESVASADADAGTPKQETKADILAAKVDAEFDSKPRGKKKK